MFLVRKCALWVFFPFIGIAGFLLSIFYGEVTHHSVQKERQSSDIQLLADPSQFTAEDLLIINTGVDKEYKQLTQIVTRQEKGDELLRASVQNWVDKIIVYRSDLRNWGMVEYLATAKETLDRRIEDCDGSAALVTAIMKYKGVKQVKIALSSIHAESRIGTERLPEFKPPRPILPSARVASVKEAEVLVTAGVALVSWQFKLDTMAEKLSGFPWLRGFFGLVWLFFWCFPLLFSIPEAFPFQHRCAVLGAVMFASSFILMECFSAHYTTSLYSSGHIFAASHLPYTLSTLILWVASISVFFCPRLIARYEAKIHSYCSQSFESLNFK